MITGNWIKVATLNEIPDGRGLRVEIGDQPIALWRVDGVIHATSDTCTHEETSLAEGDLWDALVECPLHGAQFDVCTGKVMCLPAVMPLAVYPVKVEGDSVFVEKMR